MNIENVDSTKKDSPLVGMAVVGVVLLLVLTPNPFKTLPFYFKYASVVWKWHQTLIEATLAALLVNMMFVASGLVRAFGGNKQGSKLHGIVGNLPGASSNITLSGIAASLVGGALVCALLSCYWLPGELLRLPLANEEQRYLLGRFIRADFALAATLIFHFISGFSIWSTLRRAMPCRLPAFPEVTNGLVLGTLDEMKPGKKPRWAILDLLALVGNILITGSIGSGKTSGTIFPFLRQLLSRFTPRPAVLAIDPKGRMITEALKMIEELDLNEHVVHMKLDGNVTFNPIYQKDVLKNAGFKDIGKMIRSAAVNFMGKSFDSPFWENSAATFATYCLVYCAATKGYYTLNDLYTAMVRAVSDDQGFIKDLEMCLKSERFDIEEKINIGFALQYFQAEYRKLEEKVRTGILATSTAFLNQFQEYRASRIFCPTQENLVIESMDDILNNGKILLFDVTESGLARSMGTFVKLHYEQAILNRLKEKRSTERPAVLIIDEYQDVVTTGYGAEFGDESFLSQGREANAISIMATQSLTSLENAVGRIAPTRVLWNSFRTKILGHSNDLSTIKAFQESAGQEDKKRVSHSISEHSQDASRDILTGGYDAKKTNISESVSTSEQLEYVVTAKDFARLKLYEAYVAIYDGVGDVYTKLYLKPHWLEKKNTLHQKILKMKQSRFSLATGVLLVVSLLGIVPTAFAFPNVCTVLKASESRSCMDFRVGSCMCGWPVPRPCANFSYYVPQTFVEVMPEPKTTFFGNMPGAAAQLAGLGAKPVPYGVEGDDDTQAFHAHVSSVPLTMIPFQTLPCGGGTIDRLCFEGMSEHLGSNWTTGSADLLQPNFLAWSLSPKGCLIKGALASAGGESGGGGSGAASSCSVPMAWLPKYPPSTHSACTGWGTFYPRSGVYNGPSQTTGALMVAARMKSLSSEVFHATPGSADEFWQMIYPQSSSCFREGQNVGILDAVKNVREIGRLTSGRITGYLFVVWSRVSCCRDLAEIPTAHIAIEAMNAVCQGWGG